MSNAEKSVDFARLVDWMDGRLSDREAGAVEAALAAADAATLADLAWLRRFREAAEVTPTESPPRETRDRLIEAFEARTRDQRRPGLIGRIRGGLTFDSNLQPAAGLRAGGAGQSRRQLIYHADAFDLVLNLLMRGSDDHLDLEGQLLPLASDEQRPSSVQLLHGGDEAALSVVDELGSFTLRGIPPGTYEIVLNAEMVEISIASIDVSL